MSRVAKQTLNIPDGVSCAVVEEKIICKGPNGQVEVHFPSLFELEINEKTCKINKKEESTSSAMWGSVVSNLKNAIAGVSKFFEQSINLVGVGYKVIKQGEVLEFFLGYSHTIKFDIPSGVHVDVPKPNELLLKSHDKQLLGDTVSRLEKLRKVEPYKGKGVVKVGKFYIRKEGKKK